MAGQHGESYARLVKPTRMYEYLPYILVSLAVLVFGRLLIPSLIVPGVRRVRRLRRHARLGHRFLCPQCLHFGPMLHACEECGRPVDAAWMFHTDSHAPHCPHCGVAFARRVEGIPSRLLAHCARCRAKGDAGIYHERQVQVVAVLAKEDLDAFCEDTP